MDNQLIEDDLTRIAHEAIEIKTDFQHEIDTTKDVNYIRLGARLQQLANDIARTINPHHELE